MKLLAKAIAIATLFGSSALVGQTFAATGTTTLSVTVATESAISISTPTTSLTAASVGAFTNNYVGTTNFAYKVRSKQVGGSGAITVLISTDFSTGGTAPSVKTPPVAGDAMTYTCTAVAASATACTGSVAASATTATSVATIGTDAHSAAGGSDAGSVTWTLPNDPIYKTGTYTAVATFTISAI